MELSVLSMCHSHLHGTKLLEHKLRFLYCASAGSVSDFTVLNEVYCKNKNKETLPESSGSEDSGSEQMAFSRSHVCSVFVQVLMLKPPVDARICSVVFGPAAALANDR